MFYCNVLLVSAAITTIRYSPLSAGVLAGLAPGFSQAAEVGGGATSIFLIRAASFATGPILALIVVRLAQLADTQAGGRGDLTNWLLGGTLTGVALSLAVCLGQTWVPDFFLPTRDPRWSTGLMTNPGGLAMLTIMLLPICGAVVLSKSRPHWLRAVGGANLVLVLAAVDALESKTASVGVFLSLGIYGAILVLRRLEGSIVRKGLVALGLAMALIAVLAAIAWGLAMAGLSDWPEFQSQSSFGFGVGRQERMRQLGLMFLMHPVAGTGVGTFRLLLPSFYATYGAPVGGVMYLDATNHLLHMAATVGSVGLGATVWMLLAFYKQPVVGLLRRGVGSNSPWRIDEAALAGALTYLLASNWQGETWHYVPVASVFWFLLAIATDVPPGAPFSSRPRIISTRLVA